MIIFFTEEVVISKKGEKLEIKELKPGQEVLITDNNCVWPVKIDYVGADQHIHVQSLVDGGRFVYSTPEDIVKIELMEGKAILDSVICVTCLEKQILVPITDCAACNRVYGKTVGGGCHIKIVCEDLNELNDSGKKP